ncbi:MAG: glutathione peroxidase [Myxococcales bacterium]|nr:glutathione peroxidase [Myxococcales bacterium]
MPPPPRTPYSRGEAPGGRKVRAVSHPIYDVEVETLAGEKHDLNAHRGKVLLVVNTASKCGFTPQYAGLEALYRKYSDRGLVILGFPCNQFGHQEPGSADEIGAFCQANYGVSFPMHSKIDVNGANAHPLYEHLKGAAPGLLGSKAIKWNFTKFLVDREGNVVHRYAPQTTPEKIEADLEPLLASG